jgi:spore coat polysaccharide biosynthesis protein SpsF
MKQKKINKKKPKIIAIVPARLTSSRLRAKHLYKANKKIMIHHLIDRLKSIKLFDEIVLATTTNPQDDPLVFAAKSMKIKYFRGSEQNVKYRVLLAARKFSADIICQVTGDCPLIDPALVEQLINSFLINKSIDIGYYGSFKSYGLPNGMDSCVFKKSALERSYKMTKKQEDFEHVCLHMYNNPKIFPSLYLYPPKNINFPKLSLTLDYYEDYLVIKKIIEKFKNNKSFPTCYEIVDYVYRKKLFKINSHLKRIII